MTRTEPKTDEDKIRKAAENAFLLFVSRWSTVLLVPIILGVGGWIVSIVQSLSIEVSTIRTEISSQAKIYDEKLLATDRTLSQRMSAVERRVDRLEYQQDGTGRKTTNPR